MIQKMLNQEHHVLQVGFSPDQTVTAQVCVSVCVCVGYDQTLPCVPGWCHAVQEQ